MSTWTFVRHGQSVANAEGWISGHRDVPLTDKGRSQALEVRQQLEGRSIGRLLVSDLKRALDTAQIAVGERGLTPTVTPLLRERNLGEWEGRDRAQMRATGEMNLLLTWTGAAPGGESHRDMAHRAVPWLAELDAEPNTIVVAHGGMIRTLIGLIDGDDRTTLGQRWVTNCECIHRDIGPNTWQRILEQLTREVPPPGTHCQH